MSTTNMVIDLPVADNGTPGVLPVDFDTLVRKVNTALTVIDAHDHTTGKGVVIAAGGASSSTGTWRTRGLTRSASLLGTSNLYEFYYDRMTDAAEVAGALGTGGKSGSATQTFSTATDGLMTVATSAVASNFALQGPSNTTVASWLTQSWYVRGRCKMTTGVNANGTIGLNVILSGGVIPLLAVGAVGATKLGSNANFSAGLGDNTGAALRATAFPTALDTTTYHTFEAYYVAGASVINCVMDETNAITLSTAGASTTDNAQFTIGVQNNASAVNYGAICDDLQIILSKL